MLVECLVESVRIHTLTGQHVVMLQPRDSPRSLPIWIAPSQAASIAGHLAGIRAERPETHDLVVEMLRRLGAEITRVVIKELVETSDGNGVFHGSIFIQGGTGEIEVDSRASDAIALALRSEARILVADGVLERSAVRLDGEGPEDDELTVWKQFINTLRDEPPAR